MDHYTYQGALQDFRQARFQAALSRILARVTRTSDELLSYEEVAQQLRLAARRELGIQSIPIAAIVGSVGRTADFTRTFLPRGAADMERWARVRTRFIDARGSSLPPIEVYQVGQVYFVLDGNHRVSVARREGIAFIEAHVIQFQTPIPLTPDAQPDDLIIKAEYAEFLETTGLGEPELSFDLSVSAPGQYRKLAEQIAVHQVFTSRDQARAVPYQDAAADWLATVYAPLALAIREHGLLRWFPNRTETDLYLWVAEHRAALEGELGRAVRPDAAIADLAVRSSSRAKSSAAAPGTWRRERLANRYLEHLFGDLLVPLNNTPASWNALEQALVIAQKEGAQVHGLHIVRSAAVRTGPGAHELRALLEARCAAANLAGDLIVEKGDVVRKIGERALLADLIVLHVAPPAAGGLFALGSSWRSILNRVARPVLAVPHAPSPLQRALLLFDGGPQSKQALFVAAYMAENWKTALTVLTLRDGTDASSAALAFARAYLEMHELEAEYILAEGPKRIVLDTLVERQLDVLLMGTDTASPWQQLRGNSLVNDLLRESPAPLLICP